MGTGYHDGGDLTKRQYLLVWLLHWRWQDINPQVDRLTCSKAYTAGQWLWKAGYNGLIVPVQTYRVDDLGAGNKKLADLKFADPPMGITSAPL